MPQTPMALVNNIRDRWQKFSRTQQVAIVAGIAVVLILAIAFTTLSQQSSYGVLFSNLSSQDASAIVAKLKAGKVPYKLADNGAAILVPTGVVDDTRLMIAGAGLPNKGVVGFEIFDTTNPLGMTDFTQQLDYQRGLEGELTRTIEQIQGVTGAWVNIVLPQSSLYTASDQNPTASIVVKMDAGATLDPGQVQAVMHLVASAVQGLKPENVTIVDTNGQNLSDSAQSGPLSGGITPSTYGSALDVERQYEQTLSQQAMSMLNTVLGSGKAVVRINAMLNWDQLQQDSTTYGQQPSQVSSQNTSTTTSNNGNTNQTTGAPGTGSNLVPTPTAVGVSSSGTNYNQTQNNTVYNVSQTVAHLTKAPGSVQRVTVAVFLDGQYPAATITAIQQAVSDAIGLDGTRGDQIAVSALPFSHSTEAAAAAALKTQQQQSQLEQLVRGIALALAALALIIFAMRATRRVRPGALGTTTVSLVNDVTPGYVSMTDIGSLADAQNPDAILMAGDREDILASARQRQITEAEISKRNELQQDVLKTAREHPDLMANVIMGWFEE